MPNQSFPFSFNHPYLLDVDLCGVSHQFNCEGNLWGFCLRHPFLIMTVLAKMQRLMYETVSEIKIPTFEGHPAYVAIFK